MTLKYQILYELIVQDLLLGKVSSLMQLLLILHMELGQ